MKPILNDYNNRDCGIIIKVSQKWVERYCYTTELVHKGLVNWGLS